MFSAWAVFLSMAGTTMTFQVYHSIRVGQMPWPLAVLEGVVPLGVSIGVLEYVSVWKSKLTWGAYVITAGAMFMSAVATGSVVLHAAPPHLSGLFGILLDGAALLSIRFLLTAPRAAREKAEAEASEVERLTRKLAEVTASARAEATGRAEAEATAEAEAARAARAEASAQAEALRRGEAAREMEALSAQHDEEARCLREELSSARLTLEAAQAEAARAAERARKLAAAADRNRAGSGARKPAAGTRKTTGSATGNEAPATGAEAPPDDLDSEALVLWHVAHGMSASAAGKAAGLSDSRGRQIVRELSKTAPLDVVPESAGGAE